MFRGAQSLPGGDSIKGIAQLRENRADESDFISRFSLRNLAGNGRNHHGKFTRIHDVLHAAVRAATAAESIC